VQSNERITVLNYNDNTHVNSNSLSAKEFCFVV